MFSTNAIGAADRAAFDVESLEARQLLSGSGKFVPAASMSTGVAFTAGATITLPQAVSGATAGDFNRDGIQDVAVTTSGGLYISLGAKKGRFGAPVRVATGGTSLNPVIGDFNHDKRLDIAFDSDAGISAVFGNGRGGFYPAVTIFSGPSSVEASADFDGDGNADLLCNAPFSTFVLTSNADGTFDTGADFSLASPNSQAVTADFNNDHKPDVAVLDFNDGLLMPEIGQGNGSFTAGTTITLRRGASSVAAADFNKDGFTDLGVYEGGASPNNVYLGLKRGGLSAAIPFKGSFSLVNVSSGDFNGDGYGDLVALDVNSKKLGVFTGSKSGVLTTPSLNLTLKNAFFSTADFNGDHKTDLLVGSGTATVTLEYAP